jgi:hypothetical protein
VPAGLEPGPAHCPTPRVHTVPAIAPAAPRNSTIAEPCHPRHLRRHGMSKAPLLAPGSHPLWVTRSRWCLGFDYTLMSTAAQVSAPFYHSPVDTEAKVLSICVSFLFFHEACSPCPPRLHLFLRLHSAYGSLHGSL